MLAKGIITTIFKRKELPAASYGRVCQFHSCTGLFRQHVHVDDDFEPNDFEEEGISRKKIDKLKRKEESKDREKKKKDIRDKQLEIQKKRDDLKSQKKAMSDSKRSRNRKEDIDDFDDFE